MIKFCRKVAQEALSFITPSSCFLNIYFKKLQSFPLEILDLEQWSTVAAKNTRSRADEGRSGWRYQNWLIEFSATQQKTRYSPNGNTNKPPHKISMIYSCQKKSVRDWADHASRSSYQFTSNMGNKSISQLITERCNQQKPECGKLQNEWPSFNEDTAKKNKKKRNIALRYLKRLFKQIKCADFV